MIVFHGVKPSFADLVLKSGTLKPQQRRPWNTAPGICFCTEAIWAARFAGNGGLVVAIELPNDEAVLSMDDDAWGVAGYHMPNESDDVIAIAREGYKRLRALGVCLVTENEERELKQVTSIRRLSLSANGCIRVLRAISSDDWVAAGRVRGMSGNFPRIRQLGRLLPQGLHSHWWQ